MTDIYEHRFLDSGGVEISVGDIIEMNGFLGFVEALQSDDSFSLQTGEGGVQNYAMIGKMQVAWISSGNPPPSKVFMISRQSIDVIFAVSGEGSVGEPTVFGPHKHVTINKKEF